MKKLIVEKVEDYIYYLLDNNNNKYKINMEFYDINYKKGKNWYNKKEEKEEKRRYA